jgi:KipI family sensor histidine kinase inhibitor
VTGCNPPALGSEQVTAALKITAVGLPQGGAMAVGRWRSGSSLATPRCGPGGVVCSPPMIRIETLGDRALLVTLADDSARIDVATSARVRLAAARLRGAHEALTDVVPAYASVALHYDPARVHCRHEEPPHEALARWVAMRLEHSGDAGAEQCRLMEISVRYGGEHGPDLASLAEARDLSIEEVVALHTAPQYVVHFVGFVPGFAYLGGLDPRLATPRREVPRTSVPAGSVGIGGAQTGIYPIASPGGWHLIGRTDLRLFDPSREPAALLMAGDRVRFHAVP